MPFYRCWVLRCSVGLLMKKLQPQYFVQFLCSDRLWQFWSLNLFGWAGYSLFSVLGAIIWQKDLGEQLYFVFLAVLTGFLLSLLMRVLFHRFWGAAPLRRGLLTLLVVGSASAIWSLFKLVYYYKLMEILGCDDPICKEKMSNNESWGFRELLSWYTYSFFILLCWAALYYGIKFYQALQEEKRRLAAVTRMAHEAQLKMLRYQLNPHFLFNTLNAISTLILDVQTKTANAMVTSLARFLRYTLESDPMQRVDLEEEVSVLQLYLDIEKVRFDDRLTLRFRIDDQAKKALVPSLLLQPLVENSIKYAISRREEGGTIALEAYIEGTELCLNLMDDGPGLQLEDGALPQFSGVGIANFTERLREIYGSRHRCEFSQAEPTGLKVSIWIPYETKESERLR